MLLVSRTRYRLPPAPRVAAKFDALREELDVRVLASAVPGSLTNDETFSLVPPLRPRALDGVAFWLALPWRTARDAARLPPGVDSLPDAVRRCSRAPRPPPRARPGPRRRRGPRRLAHVDPAVRLALATGSRPSSATRLRPPRSAAPTPCARSRRSPRVSCASSESSLRAISRRTWTSSRSSSPRQPLPEKPVALFVGVLEAYKSVDVLAAAWRLAAPRVPDASLHVVGKGARTDIAESLVRDCGARWDRELSSAQVAAAMDGAWVLVLPSRSEGMGRVLVEAFCRGRGVVGTRAGSIPELVTDGESGLLVEPDDPSALADALVRVLSDRVARRAAGRGRPCRRSGRGCRRRRSTRGASGSSSHEVGCVHHAGGGSGASGARRDAAEDPRACGAGRRGRRPRRHDRAGGAAGELPRAQLRRVVAGGARSAVPRRARAGADASTRCGRRAHGTGLRPDRRAARASAARAAAALVHAAGRRRAARRGRAGRRRGGHGGRAERPAALGEGACDRARDRRRLAALRAGASSTAAPPARPRPLRAREGLGDRRCARCRSCPTRR